MGSRSYRIVRLAQKHNFNKTESLNVDVDATVQNNDSPMKNNDPRSQDLESHQRKYSFKNALF